MSSSKTQVKEEVDSSTNITTENKQVTASENSLAIGTGANVNIQSLDAQVAQGGFDAVERIAGKSQELSARTTEASLAANKSTTESALSFGRDALGDVTSALSEANQILARSNESAQEKIQRAAGVDKSTIQSESNKGDKILIGAGLVAILTLAVMNKKGSK